MKIILVGASGTLGSAIAERLGSRHDLIRVGRRSGDVQVDITQPDTIRALFAKVGRFDALVSATGALAFAPVTELTQADFQVGLSSKLMGQVNLVLLGQAQASDGASFTLTSGIVSEHPIHQGSAAAMVNAGLEGFARGAAIELPRGQRLNVVSPTVVEESLARYGDFFLGFKAIPVAEAARAYERSVEGRETGKTYRVW
ncbi:short chain dehydrogenase [Pseudomonas sp. MS15a(2019)]|uniref:short chain dehydrogenase n=1 Tax=Pseudomonas sp. MS15a(2019) TaxID=2579938 RepID=UPI0015635B70|nr:short chain dehydrogenase [Pseudomonas sp. MS15a(2019)]NRH42224.1 short chain dehydrogenase [Pseudomonas sp. MS15a(2019)]